MMKKIFKVVAGLTFLTLLSLSVVGCGPKAPTEEEIKAQKTQEAFDASKAAYDNVNSAYGIVEAIGDDIYEAWRLGINEKDELKSDGVKHLSYELDLSDVDLTEGIAYTFCNIVNDAKWEEATDEEKKKFRDLADYSFTFFEDDLFSFCVEAVRNSYILNGKVAEAQEYLDSAKSQMKDLSANFSDYEHYPALKGYYTTTSSFFDFCQNPTGSFEQLKSTIDDYRNKARDYNADLDYIFED